MSPQHRQSEPNPNQNTSEILNTLDSSPDVPVDEVDTGIRSDTQNESEVHTTDNKPKHQKSLDEKFDYFIAALEQFSAAILLSDFSNEQVARLQSTLPQLIDQFKQKRDHYVNMLYRPHEGRENFEVTVSYLLFGVDPKHDQDPHKKDFFISYAAEKLGDICRDYFEIDVEKLKPKAVKKTVDKDGDHADKAEDIEKKGSTELAVLTIEKTNLIKSLSSAIKRTKDVALASVAAVAASTGGLAMLALKKLMPDRAAEFMMKNLMQKKMHLSQSAGTGTFFDSKLPITLFNHKIQLRHGGVVSNSMYTSIDLFTEYDPDSDKFINPDQHTQPQLYKRTPELYRNRQNQVLSDLREANRLYDFEILHLLPDITKDNETGLCSIPTPILFNNNTELIPISFSVNIPGEAAPVDCPLLYDNNRLYFDPSALPPGAQNMTGNLEYTTWSKSDGEKKPLHLDFFMKKNPAYFRREARRAHEVDKKAAETKIPADLAKKIEDWKKLSTIESKIQAVKSYFSTEFAYGLGAFTKLRIAFQRGDTAIEKTINAKEGNCFDINKIGFVVLQKLGIPAEFHTGFGDQNEDENPTQTKKPFMIPDIKTIPLGAEVGVEAGENPITKIAYRLTVTPSAHSKHTRHTQDTQSHAFLQYFDDVKQQWTRLDLTPSNGRSRMLNNKREDAKSLKKTMDWEKKRTLLEQQNGMKPYEQCEKEWDLLRKRFSDTDNRFKHTIKPMFVVTFDRGMTQNSYSDSEYEFFCDPDVQDIYFPSEKKYTEAYKRNQIIYPIIEHFKEGKERIVLNLVRPLEHAIDEFIAYIKPTSKTAKELEEDLNLSWGKYLTIPDGTTVELKDILLKFLLANRNGSLSPKINLIVKPYGSIVCDGITLRGTLDEIISDVKEFVDEKMATWEKGEEMRIGILIDVLHSAKLGTTTESLYDQTRLGFEKAGLITPISLPEVKSREETEKVPVTNTIHEWQKGNINGIVVEGKWGRGLKLTDPETGKPFIIYGASGIDGFDEMAQQRINTFQEDPKRSG